MPEPIVGVRCTQARQPADRDVSTRALERVAVRTYLWVFLDVRHEAIIVDYSPDLSNVCLILLRNVAKSNLVSDVQRVWF